MCAVYDRQRQMCVWADLPCSSSTISVQPSLARWYATDVPTTPPPQMTTRARAGRAADPESELENRSDPCGRARRAPEPQNQRGRRTGDRARILQAPPRMTAPLLEHTHTDTHTHRERERETHTHIHTQRHTHTHTQRERERHTHTHTDTHTHTQTHRERERDTHTHTHVKFLLIVGTFHRLLLLLFWPNNIFYPLTLLLTENLFAFLHFQINIIYSF